MRRALVLAAFGIICAVSLACQPGAGGLTDEDRAAFRQGDEALLKTALSEKPDWPALAAELYAQDAVLLPPEESPVKGLDAIKAWYSPWPSFKEFKLTEVRREGSGSFAYLHYGYEVVPRVPEPVAEKGKGLTVFRKEADGRWKNVAECWNADTPPSGIKVPTASVAPDASPELKKLGAIVGRWKFDGTFKTDPEAAGGAVDLMFTCGWFAGGQQVVCQFSGTMAGSPFEELGVYTHNPKTKAHAYYGIANDGTAAPGVVTIKPGSWLHAYDVQVGGRPAEARFTLSNMSAAGGDWRYESSIGGGPWTTMGEGKYTKAN